MLSFESDYILGAHEKVLEALIKTNAEMLPGYGNDTHTKNAESLIKCACNSPDSDVFFITGGTQANKTIIATMLKPYEGVIAPTTGHISLHEVGAIEYTGHQGRNRIPCSPSYEASHTEPNHPCLRTCACTAA